MTELVTLTLNLQPAMAVQVLHLIAGAGEAAPVPGKPVTPKATKAKEAPAAEPVKAEAPKVEEASAEVVALDYGKDVRPKIIAAVGRLSKTLGNPDAAKAKVLETLGEFCAPGEKEPHGEKVPREQWPALVAAVEKLGA